MAEITLNYNEKSNSKPTQSGWNSFDVDYNGSYIFTIADFTTNTNPPYYDPEGDELSLVKITTTPIYGEITLNNNAITGGEEINASDINSGFLAFIPNANYAGFSDSTTKFLVADSGSNTYNNVENNLIFNISIDENLAPSSVGSLNLSITNSSYHVFTVNNFTTETTPAYSDPEGDDPKYLRLESIPQEGVLTLDNEEIVLNEIASFNDIALGKLKYVSDSSNQLAHSDGFSFAISDEGSEQFTTGGSVSFSIEAYVNQAPTVGNSELTIDEGSVITFSRSNFLTDPDPDYIDVEGDVAVAVRFPTLPASGTIKLNNVDVTANQEIDLADVDSGLLTYTQGSNAGGTTSSFTFNVKDSFDNWSN